LSNRFKRWLLDIYQIESNIVIAFASSFCRVKVSSSFIEKITKITEYIYNIPYESLIGIVNPNNDQMINIALFSNRQDLTSISYYGRLFILNNEVNINIIEPNSILNVYIVQYILEVSEINPILLSHVYRNIGYQLNIFLTPIKHNINCVLDISKDEKYLSTRNECCICLEEKENKNFVEYISCKHSFCNDCVEHIFKKENQEPTCSLCRAKVTSILVTNFECQNKLSNYIV
jgi:hypothetical protein